MLCVTFSVSLAQVLLVFFYFYYEFCRLLLPKLFGRTSCECTVNQSCNDGRTTTRWRTIHVYRDVNTLHCLTSGDLENQMNEIEIGGDSVLVDCVGGVGPVWRWIENKMRKKNNKKISLELCQRAVIAMLMVVAATATANMRLSVSAKENVSLNLCWLRHIRICTGFWFPFIARSVQHAFGIYGYEKLALDR